MTDQLACHRRVGSLVAAALLLAGCDRGRLTLGVTDAPVDDATAVTIEIRGVELDSIEQGLQTVEFDPPLRIDLLGIPTGQSRLLLDGESVPAGEYSQVRLLVNAEAGETDSIITLSDGGVHSLHIADADRPGLTLQHSFDLPGAGQHALTIDFNLRKSIEPRPSGGADFPLRPVLRIVNDEDAGRITGAVAGGRIVPGCTPAIYVFEGEDVEPDDVDTVSAEAEPLTSARVEFDIFNGLFTYTTPLLTAGDYTISFTCDAALDDPLEDDPLDFPVTRTVTVEAGLTVTVGIPN